MSGDDVEFDEFKKSLRGVKELVDSGIRQVPKFYMRSDSRMEVQASTDAPEGEVPVIDLRGVEGPRRAAVVESIAKASEEWGFFQIINHGVPLSAMQDMLKAVEEFFNAPIEERMKFYSTNLSQKTRVGTSHNILQETSLEWKDYLRHSCLPLEEAMQTWPTAPSTYRKIASDYCTHVKAVCDVLLELLSESLGLNPDHLNKVFGDQKLQEMFCNYYPPCPNPELTIGIGEHSDAGGITVLLQNEVEGLEVFNKGLWYTVKPVQGAFVVNLADQIQILSNGRFRSVEHRAKVNTGRLRISVPTFYLPSMQAEMSPIAELVNEEHPPVYRKFRFDEYVCGYFKLKFHGKKYIDSFKL